MNNRKLYGVHKTLHVALKVNIPEGKAKTKRCLKPDFRDLPSALGGGGVALPMGGPVGGGVGFMVGWGPVGGGP